jgi:hypothetical protein
MSDRITNKQVEGLFKTLATKCGRRVATSYDDVGAWRLDYNSVYGGWNIEEISSATGGVTNPLGESRRKNAEMWYTMHFALRAIDACKHAPRSGSFRRSRLSRRR